MNLNLFFGLFFLSMGLCMAILGGAESVVKQMVPPTGFYLICAVLIVLGSALIACAFPKAKNPPAQDKSDPDSGFNQSFG